MSRKRDFRKVYTKIDEIAKEGRDYIHEYMKLIDELVDDGLFFTLSDVMQTKYGLKIEDFDNLDQFKKSSFKKIRMKTNFTTPTELSKLFRFRSVYQIGNKFYDNYNNHYLGDITEVEVPYTELWYRNPDLRNNVINLEVVSGLPQSLLDAIPPFVDSPSTKITFSIEDVVRYEGNIWECVQSYTYAGQNRITPTYSNYWMQIFSPTYSHTIIDDTSLDLVGKYNKAIDIVKSFIYLDPSSSNYIESNYLDDYFE